MSDLHDINILGIDVKVYDKDGSIGYKQVEQELNNDFYNLKNINFNNEDIIIDVGSHIGIVSIYISKRFPNVKIYSLEPSFSNFSNLIKNIEINNCKNIYPLNFGLLDETRFKNLVLSSKTIDHSSMINTNSLNFIEENCFFISIDNLINLLELKKVSLLKIDCEGAEYLIFDKFKDYDIIDKLVIEIHSCENLGFNRSQLCEKLFKNLGNRLLIV